MACADHGILAPRDADKTEFRVRIQAGDQPCRLKPCHHAGGIVIAARASGCRIVMGRQDQDIRILQRAPAHSFHIGPRDKGSILVLIAETLALHLIPVIRQKLREVTGGVALPLLPLQRTDAVRMSSSSLR